MRTRFFEIALLIVVGLGVAEGQTYKFSTLYSSKNNGKDPITPTSLILDSAGNLYGTSSLGGTYGSGTVFKVTPKGVLTVLHSFNGTSDGASPFSLVRNVKQGSLYGSSTSGAFKLTEGKGGTYTFSVLYSTSKFQSQGVALNSTGNLYGTEYACPDGNGCVFEIPSGGKWTDVYDCCIGGTQSYPTSNLVFTNSGNIFGAADEVTHGGANGWIFEWPSGAAFVLSAFDDQYLLRQDAAGNIYGYDNYYDGITGYYDLFKLDPTTGAFSTIYIFCSLPNCADGDAPMSDALTLDSVGNFYGATSSGGSNGYGVVFKVTPSGQESVLYNFASYGPSQGFVMDKSGNLYGTTFEGGASQLGSVYKLTLQK
jgi:uncharacterized repeat protein (TIGR03803 family)